MSFENINIDDSWTLFLDRDGVINRKIDDDYVREVGQFEFLPGALGAIRDLASIFPRVIVLTNQRGIARGLMTENDLEQVHTLMIMEIAKNGGRLDGIFHCPHDISDDCDCRKPKTGLALQARTGFPEIDFKKSILLGDKASDIDLGKSLGMKTVLVGKESADIDADLVVDNIYNFAQIVALARN